MYTLEKWSVCSPVDSNNDYIPPGSLSIALQAKESNRPGFEDGIVTTRIVQLIGRVAMTKSGTKYLLGEPDPDYVEWCLERNMHDPRDPSNPIKVHGILAIPLR